MNIILIHNIIINVGGIRSWTTINTYITRTSMSIVFDHRSRGCAGRGQNFNFWKFIFYIIKNINFFINWSLNNRRKITNRIRISYIKIIITTDIVILIIIVKRTNCISNIWCNYRPCAITWPYWYIWYIFVKI